MARRGLTRFPILAGLGLCLAASIAGCATRTSPAPSSSASTQPKDWKLTLQAQGDTASTELTLRDRTGLVIGIGPGQAVRAGLSSLTVAVDRLAESDRQLLVSWTGGSCAKRLDMSVDRVGERLILTSGQPPSDGCNELAVTYGFGIFLASPIELTDVVARDDGSSGRSWGVLITGSDGISRPIVVIDETRLSTLAVPIEPAQLPALDRDVIAELVPSGDLAARVLWRSNMCEDRMSVSVGRDAAQLAINVELDRSGHGGACSATHTQGLRLTFADTARWQSVTGAISH
jgi:hypothetical protein